MNPATILIADDHPLTLAGIRAAVEPHYNIVGTVTDGQALVEAALRLRPDVLIVDIGMPILNGIDAANQIRKAWPEVKLIFVTMHLSPAYLAAALDAGAVGYVVKSAAGTELLLAVKAVLEGRTWVTPSVFGENAERFARLTHGKGSVELTARERHCLQLIAEGRASKEIAYIMSISAKTVAFHRDNLKRKLGLKTTAELTRYAVEQHLV